MTQEEQDKEQWLPLPGYEGVYLISDLGRVKRAVRRGNWLAGGYLKHQKNTDGYSTVILYSGVTRRFLTVHKLVLLAFVGPKPSPQHMCRHLDGNRANPRLSNLAWGTAYENCADKVRHSTDGSGIRNGRAKLSEEDVREIRRQIKEERIPQRTLAKKYGVVKGTIAKIALRQLWSHLS